MTKKLNRGERYTDCVGRKDSVRFLQNGKAFNATGECIGSVDQNNELKPKKNKVEKNPVNEVLQET